MLQSCVQLQIQYASKVLAGLGPILSFTLKSWKFLVSDPAAKRMKENYTSTALKTDVDIGGLYGTVYSCGHHFPMASAIDKQI